MKKHSTKNVPGLNAFSRDHGVALVCAQYGRKAVRASTVDRLKLAQKMRSICREQITPNLEDEQWILSPLIADSSLRAEFHLRHRNIRQLAAQLSEIELSDDPGLGLVARVANALDDYVRWEENTLYPRLTESIDKMESKDLSRLTSSMESKRDRFTQQLHASVAMRRPSGFQNEII